MKYLLTFCILFLYTLLAQANSAMPGIWETGANGKFVPLFAKDSIYFDKIKMQQEQILINLYPGFAVVKGEYWMYNTTASTISMHVTYPKQGGFDAAVVKNILPTYISALQVKVNDKPVALTENNDTSSVEKTGANKAIKTVNHYSEWFLWEMKFAPKSITKITVYFITDNSNATVSKGYSKRPGDAFTYVLESGRAWGGVIDTGRIFIQLKGGLTQQDITGVLPDSTVFAAGGKILYAFTSKEPLPKDNLLLYYKDSPANFDFKSQVLPNAENYFKEIDSFNTAAFLQSKMQLVHKLDMLPNDSGLGFFGWIGIGILAGAVSIIAFVIWLVILGIKSTSKRRKADW